jgi:hypothetical protein
LVAEALGKCPLTPIGVTETQTDRGGTFTASAFVRPLREDQDALADARTEARIAAKLLLRHNNRVPRESNGRLSGVMDLGSCIDSGRVYNTVSVDSKSAAEAIELNKILRTSLAEKPAPLPSFSWFEDKAHDKLSDQIRQTLQH